MNLDASRARGPLLHLVALAILLWPLAGITYVPMVDLPGHLAITRVLDDFLHGQYHDKLQLNLDPVYKPTYALLYVVYAAVPKTMVGAVAIGIMVAICYAAACWSIATLAERPAASPIVVALATVVAMFCYGAAFFWGLIPFLLAAPPALVAYAAYLRASGLLDAGARTRRYTAVFLVAALVAHAVHPLSSFFLAMMLGPAALVACVRAAARRAHGTSPRAHVWAAVWPLLAWVPAVLVLHRLGTTARQEVDVAQSMAAVTAPLHGVGAALAFLAQIPVDLGMLPTRNPAATLVSYPVATVLVLAVASVVALATARRTVDRRTADGRGALGGLAAAFTLSALLFLFIRHDIVKVSIGALWYPVRGPAFLVFFFGTLGAVLLLRALDASRIARPLAIAVTVCCVAITAERSAVLRTHFTTFDREVGAFFRSESPDRWIRQQPVNYIDHIRLYNCYFDAACPDQRRLFFSIYPDATIYPLSKIRTPPPGGAAEQHAP